MDRVVQQTKIKTAVHYSHENVVTESFQLSHLDQAALLAPGTSLDGFQRETGLADLFWRAMYYRRPGFPRDLDQALAEADFWERESRGTGRKL